MAQPGSPRNTTFYGLPDGQVATDAGAAEGWRANGAAPKPAPLRAWGQAAINTARGLKPTWGGATRAALTGIPAAVYTANHLANTGEQYGRDAMLEEAPGAVGNALGWQAAFSSRFPGAAKTASAATEAAKAPSSFKEAWNAGRSGYTAARAADSGRAAATARAAWDATKAGSWQGAKNVASGSIGRTVAGLGKRTFAGAPVAAGLEGAANSFTDQGTGYADQYKDNLIGKDRGFWGDLAGNAALTFENVGNAIPLVARTSNLLRGNGFDPTTDRDRFYEARRQQQANASGAAAAQPTDARPTSSTRPLTTRARTPGLPATTPNDPRVAKASAPSPYDAPPQSMREFGQQLAAQYAAQPQQVATMNDNSDRISLRGTQGGTIRNPNAMSTTDRIASLGGDPRLKGFPSLRRAMAEQIMAEDKRYDDQFNKSQDINAQAELAQAKMQADARDAFANRRLKADMFNTGTTEGRRTGDLDRGLKASMFDVSTSESRRKDDLDRLVTAALGRVRGTRSGVGASGSATGTNGDDFANGNYTDIAKKYGGDYNQDAVSTWKNAVDAGEDPSASPLGRIAMTRMQDANAESLREMGRRWFASAPQNVSTDPRDAIPVDRDWVDKLSTIWPGGIDSNDYKYRDAKTGEEYYSAQAPFASADQMARARSLRDAFRTPAK